MEKTNASITAPKGFKAAGISSGLKKSGKKDICLLASEVPAAAAAVFTTNKAAAAPVQLCRENIRNGYISVVVTNSGCANACTGERGMNDARAMVSAAASAAGVPENRVLIASTGVIGTFLEMDKLTAGITAAWSAASVNGGEDAAEAIRTTDTFAKNTAYKTVLGGKEVLMSGMAKGSGMICPNMATMLAYITTDAAITPEVLRIAMSAVADESFNMAVVDGDTSTNDSFFVFANGLAGNPVIDSTSHPDYAEFHKMLLAAATDLAKLIVRDGEGATKFMEILVCNAASRDDARNAAKAIAKSPLVKTAFFGQDGNWGRIVCAVGYSGTAMAPEKTKIFLDEVPIFRDGVDAGSHESAIEEVMKRKDIKITVDLGLGEEQAKVWTCDFSYDYVKINGSFRS